MGRDLEAHLVPVEGTLPTRAGSPKSHFEPCRAGEGAAEALNPQKRFHTQGLAGISGWGPMGGAPLGEKGSGLEIRE